MFSKVVGEKIIEKSPRKYRRWIILILVILYFISPIDLVPEFLPGLGFADDFLLIVFALYQFFKKDDPSSELFEKSSNSDKINNKQNKKNAEAEIVEGEIIED